jgi:hypothetical protein
MNKRFCSSVLTTTSPLPRLLTLLCTLAVPMGLAAEEHAAQKPRHLTALHSDYGSPAVTAMNQ